MTKVIFFLCIPFTLPEGVHHQIKSCFSIVGPPKNYHLHRNKQDRKNGTYKDFSKGTNCVNYLVWKLWYFSTREKAGKKDSFQPKVSENFPIELLWILQTEKISHLMKLSFFFLIFIHFRKLQKLILTGTLGGDKRSGVIETLKKTLPDCEIVDWNTEHFS